MHASAAGDDSTLLDERALSKLHWRCRRGLLENDLIIERFFDHYAATLTVGQANGLHELMDLADNDLLDLLLGRTELATGAASRNLTEVLGMLRSGRQRVPDQRPG